MAEADDAQAAVDLRARDEAAALGGADVERRDQPVACLGGRLAHGRAPSRLSTPSRVGQPVLSTSPQRRCASSRRQPIARSAGPAGTRRRPIGRAACTTRGCPYVLCYGGAEHVKKK